MTLAHAAAGIAQRLERGADIAVLQPGVFDRKPRGFHFLPEQGLAGDAADRREANAGDRIFSAQCVGSHVWIVPVAAERYYTLRKLQQELGLSNTQA